MTEHTLFYSPLSADPDLYDIVARFVKELPDRIDAMRLALESEDWASLTRCAHQLKGASGSYGFHPLSPACHAVETAAADTDLKSAQQSLTELTALCQRVRADAPG